MSPLDYGPVPVSRLKTEAGAVFQALQEGRRVFISRHGVVVAAIDPVSLNRHVRELARFALPVEDDEALPQLTAREFQQGSLSDYVRRAEEGSPSLVTRANKVYGVLTSPGLIETVESVDEREKALASFERQHPDASAEDFAAAVAALASLESVSPPTSAPFLTRAESIFDNISVRTLVGALKEKVESLKDKGGPEPDLVRVVVAPNMVGKGTTIGFEGVPQADVLPGTIWSHGGVSTVAAPLSTDTYLKSGHLIVEMDLAGVDPDSIDIELEGSALIVRTERQMPSEVDRWLIRERTRGPLTRRIILNEGVDLDAVEAEYENGVLKIILPASDAADDSRRIPVQRGSLSDPAVHSRRQWRLAESQEI